LSMAGWRKAKRVEKRNKRWWGGNNVDKCEG